MAIRGWHPGKIAVVWVVTLASRFCLGAINWEQEEIRRPADLFWFFFVVLAAAITWRWLGGREDRSR